MKKKKHIPVEFSNRSAQQFVGSMIEKRRKIESLSGKRRMDGIMVYLHQKGGISDEHLTKYENERTLL